MIPLAIVLGLLTFGIVFLTGFVGWYATELIKRGF